MNDSKKILLPDGSYAGDPAGPVTGRSLERAREDESYTSVIVKRVDEARPHPDDMLEHAISEGATQLKRPFISLFLSALAGGLILGFSVMAVAVVASAIPVGAPPVFQRLAMALVYPLGFVVCVMSGSQLFTEHTATAVYPVLDRRAGVGRLLRLWGTVISGNLLGTFTSAYLLHSADSVIGAERGYIEIGHHLVAFGTGPLLLSAMLAGWLMAQGAWLVIGTAPAFSQMLSIYLVTFLIGVGGLHHSVAGSAEMFVAVFTSSEFTAREAVRFIATALAGNLVGGSVFVAVLNYAHIRETQRV